MQIIVLRNNSMARALMTEPGIAMARLPDGCGAFHPSSTLNAM
jgi:hypothetical protein